MKTLRDILSESRDRLMIKITFAIFLIIHLGYYLVLLVNISHEPTTNVLAVRRNVYAMIGLGLLSAIFYVFSSTNFSNSVSTLRGQFRSALRKDSNLGKDERMNLIREMELDFHEVYVKRQVLFAMFGLLSYILIVFTNGILDIIAKIAVVGITTFYYLKFQEDPIELLDSKKYDRQLIDETGGVSIIRSENFGKMGLG